MHSSIDDLDFKILHQLQQDGRKSFTDIAKDLNVSVGTIRNRVTRLLEDETLRVIGMVDPNQIGFHSYANILIKVQPVEVVEEVSKAISEIPEVSFLALISGEHDLEVHVQCRDNDHLIELMNNKVFALKGVSSTKTQMYFKVVKIAQPDLSLIRPGYNQK